MYLDPPYLPLLEFLASRKINNLRVINAAYGFESHPSSTQSRLATRSFTMQFWDNFRVGANPGVRPFNDHKPTTG